MTWAHGPHSTGYIALQHSIHKFRSITAAEGTLQDHDLGETMMIILLRRLLDALIEARLQKARSEVARYLPGAAVPVREELEHRLSRRAGIPVR
jgi:hypothetical protein